MKNCYMYTRIFSHEYMKIPAIQKCYAKGFRTKSITQNLQSNHKLCLQHLKSGKCISLLYNNTHRYFNSDKFMNDNFINDKNHIFLSFLDSYDTDSILCPNVSLDKHSLDPIISILYNSLTINEILEILNQVSEPLSLDQACQSVFSLSRIKNVDDLDFKESAVVRWKGRENFRKIHAEFQFYRVLMCIKNNIMSLSLEQMSSLIMCLSNLELELHNEIMVLLHLHSLRVVSKLNLKSIAQLSFVFGDDGYKSYSIQMKMLNQIKLKTQHCQSLEDFSFISVFYLNSTKVMSKEMAQLYISTLRKFVNEKYFDDLDPDIILLILKLMINLNKNNCMEVCRPLIQLLYDLVPTLKPYQLVILNNIFLHFGEPRPLMYKIQEYASRLLDQNENTDLKFDLLLCLCTHSNLKMRLHYSSLAEKGIIDSHDYRNTTSFYNILRSLNIPNFKLFHEFWLKLLSDVKQAINDCDEKNRTKEKDLVRAYTRYAYFNGNFGGNFRSYKFEEGVRQILKKELKGHLQYFPYRASSMIGFLIAYSKISPQFQQFYESLQRVYLQLNSSDWIFLSKCIKSYCFQNHLQREDFTFLVNISELMNEATKHLLTEADSLAYVVELMTAHTALITYLPSPSAYIDILAHSHLKYIDELNSREIIIIMKNFLSSSSYFPEIFEAVTSYIIAHAEDILPITIFRVLRCFFFLGFIPAKSSEFLRICMNILEMDSDKMPTYHLLTCCLALCFYQSLSSELIQYIFSIPFLNQIDEEMKYSFSKNYLYMVRSTLMKLNRAVCLDYPEEKIPWFHENYVKDQNEIQPTPITLFHKDICEILCTVLGTTQHIQMNNKVAYGYNVDVYFALDNEGKPFPIQDRSDNNTPMKKPKEIHTKVAVLLRNDKCYTRLQRVLKGEYQMERRHLEILGYVVVEVPERSWYSMAVGRKEDKMNLLRSLISKELSGVS